MKTGGIEAEEYIEVLCDGLFFMIDDLLRLSEDPDAVATIDRHAFLFMHDNARCHVASSVKKLLEDYGISIMIWPANSSDLNSLERI